MNPDALAPQIAALPATLPIFPLTGVLLLPRGRLPLNIFEPRYLDMLRDALGADRMIGIIQPSDPKPRGKNPPVFTTGCAGRVTQFSEEGERFLITLTGICRFNLVEELPTTRGYRRIVPDWRPYYDDFREPTETVIDRERLLLGLRLFFKVHGLSADWDAIAQTPDERLITSLAMICPFEPSEKQALLEASDLTERSRVLTALIEMSAIDPSSDGDTVRH
ncbi:MAG TPA: LON peptidase substrate-binding domain-containing protein [Stellaceae bacterium]|nr:LON peptidase substrate-binding domain-containing protein [Stellaceae bacterium]